MSQTSPKPTVDAVILGENSIVLVKRRNPPFKGMWALPGGFVECGETVEEAAVREAKEETGLDVGVVKLLGVYSDPKRDPRGPTVGTVFICKRIGGQLKADTDAIEVKEFAISDLPALAFDHGKIVADALERIYNCRKV
jgi:8-oxo-dGTP diphosphatase